MSRTTTAKKNKQQKHQRVDYEQYLYDASEPKDYPAHDTPAELEAELLENSYFMRRHFRRLGQNLRNHRS